MDFSDFAQLPANLQAAVTYQELSTQQPLFHQQEPSTAIFAVKTGRIRLLHYTESGQAIEHYLVNAGEVFAEVVLFTDVYVCSAIAPEPTCVMVFPKQEFWKALQQSFSLSAAFMEQLATRLHMNKVMLELRGIRSARERVLHYLRFAAHPAERTVLLDVPLKNIAQNLGISPEVLSRTLTQLEAEGAIARNKRRIQLINE